MKTKTPEVNPNPKPYTEWILRPISGWLKNQENTPMWLFSEDGTAGYWEFAFISSFKKDGSRKTTDEIKQEAKEAYELFYGKQKN